MEDKEKTWLRDLADRILGASSLSLGRDGKYWKTKLSQERKDLLADALHVVVDDEKFWRPPEDVRE